MKYWLCFILLALPFWSRASELVERRIRFATAAYTSQAPIIDGRLDEACWQHATRLTDFRLTAGEHGRPAANPTTGLILYDDTHLYVGFECSDSEPSGIKATSREWDDHDILYDDRVEIFIDANHDHRSYVELAVNPLGVQFDQTCFNRLHGSKTCDMDPNWNGSWRARTRLTETGWTAEIVVDVSSFGLKELHRGVTWGFNIARVRQPDVEEGDEFFKREPHGPAEYSAWAPVKDYIRETISNFHAPIEFGDLVFGDPGFEVTALRFRSAKYAFGPVGYPSLFGFNPLEVEVRLPQGGSKKVVAQVTVEPESVARWSEEKNVVLQNIEPIHLRYFIPEDLENKITLRLLDADTGQPLYTTSYVELAPPFIEFDLEPLYARNLKPIYPVRFKLLMDDETRSSCRLELSFREAANGRVVETARFDNLDTTDRFTDVFDIQTLRDLPGGNYRIDCQLYRKTGKRLARFVQNLTKFEKELPGNFAVREGDYSYGGITNHAIFLEYPFPARFVFWRSASYIPFWDCDQAAMTNEFIECWGAGNQGCNEPMQDRECRYSGVEVIEESPARVVVHWRYALSDPHYRIYRNEWVDEYYVMYPDGVGIREVNLWPNSNTRHEMFEVLLAKPPGVRTQQLYDPKFATLSNLKGESHSNKEFTGRKKFYKSFLASDDDFIIEVHFKDRMHPFTVFSFREELLPGVTRNHVTAVSKEMASADQRGHWPASRYQIDGYNTVGLDVPNHGNIGNIQAEVDPANQPTTWTFLIGVKEHGSQKDVAHARSWLYPAKVRMLSRGWKYHGYDFSERTYSLATNAFSEMVKLEFDASQHPIVHPVFRFSNPKASLKEITIGQHRLSAKEYRLGTAHQGGIIVFVNRRIEGKKQIRFRFERAKSDTQASLH